MPTLQYADIDDAVQLTQDKFIRMGAFVDMQLDLQDHIAVRELWKGRKKVFEGGDSWRWEVQMDHNYTAHTVGLYETDGTADMDTMTQGEVHPRHVNAHYAYDKRLPSFQRGGRGIVDLVKTKYTAMMCSLYKLMEEILWGKPADLADDKTPYGIDYWVTKANVTAGGGFEGVDPFDGTTTATKGGISGGTAGTYPRWSNWTCGYEAISKENLIRFMRRGHRMIGFRSPVSHATPDLGSMKNGIYTNDTVLGLMEEELEDQNMNLGNDLASKDGKTLFKSTPVIYVPYLNASADNPVYMLDWKWMALGVLTGWENQLSKPYMVPNKHLVSRVDLDCTLQMVCTDLRRQAVFYDVS